MTEDSPLLLIISSFAGALAAVVTFGFWLRDRVFTYLRSQNTDLFAELTNLSDEIRIIRGHQHETALHLMQQDIDADRHAADVIKATSELTNTGDTSKSQ